MLAIAATAITIQDAFQGNQQEFAIAFATVQIIITYLWWSIGLYDPGHRVFSIYYTVSYSIAFILLIVSAFASYDTATTLWVTALIFNLAPPVVGGRNVVKVLKQRGQVFTASAAIVERFGLFTIIVLAESVLGIVTGIAEISDKQAAVWFAFILAMLIAFLLWSLYFDMTSEQETKEGYWYLQCFVLLHFPLLASLGVVGACMKVSLANMQSGLAINLQWMMSIATASILYMIIGVTRIMKEDEEDRSYIRPVSGISVIAALCILAIPLFGRSLTTLTYFSLLAVILLIPVFVGVKHWIRYKFFSDV